MNAVRGGAHDPAPHITSRFKRLSIPDEEVDRILSECIAALNGKVAPSPDGFLLTSTKIARVTAKQAAAVLEGQRTPHKPTLASVTKQARKAGIDPARIEVKPDGTIVVVTGKPEQQQSNEVDDWIAKHARAPERH